jgi:hypothetical protein
MAGVKEEAAKLVDALAPDTLSQRDDGGAVVNEQGDVVARSAAADVRELRGLLKRARRRAVSVETMNAAILHEHAGER